MEIVVTALELDVKNDQQKAGYSYGEAQDVDKRVDFMPSEISQGNF
jgi:hypothetical protein